MNVPTQPRFYNKVMLEIQGSDTCLESFELQVVHVATENVFEQKSLK